MKIFFHIRQIFCLIGFLILCLSGWASNANANLYINLVAVNASTEETKEKPIKYYLPKEVEPENIVNSGGLQLDFDLERSQYFLYGSVKLAPKESKTIKVEVQDIWKIDQEEIGILKQEIENNLSQLDGTEYYDSAKILSDNMIRKIDYVLAQQENYSDNIERRIEEYRAYIDSINEIRKNAFSMDYFKSQPVVSHEEEGTVRFIIEAENTLKDSPKTITQKYYLPNEIRSEDIVDRQGFDVRYDDEKGQAYLLKTEEFKPAEKKRYTIVIKDIWVISLQKVESLRKKTQAILDDMKGSEYEEASNYIGEKVLGELQEIQDSQAKESNVRKHIGDYRVNIKRLARVEEDIRKIERMLATVRAKKLEEFEKSKVRNVLQKLQALRGITAISQAVFGKRPSMTTTWYVIWGIMVFVGLFTTVHFFTWWRKARTMGEEMAIRAGGKIEEVQTQQDSEEKS